MGGLDGGKPTWAKAFENMGIKVKGKKRHRKTNAGEMAAVHFFSTLRKEGLIK